MITQDIKAKLKEAAAEVFGTMYFMSIQLMEELPDKVMWDLDEWYIVATISFSGPDKATVKFAFPGGLSRNVACGFLGLEETDVSDQQVIDTMREAANMVGGGFLGKLDPDGGCRLGLPAAALVNDFSPLTFSGDMDDVLVFRSEFGYIWVSYGE